MPNNICWWLLHNESEQVNQIREFKTFASQLNPLSHPPAETIKWMQKILGFWLAEKESATPETEQRSRISNMFWPLVTDMERENVSGNNQTVQIENVQIPDNDTLQIYDQPDIDEISTQSDETDSETGEAKNQIDELSDSDRVHAKRNIAFS